MNLLNRNHYAIWFSDRCNFKCSYCCNRISPLSKNSILEDNTALIIDFFNKLEPGCFMISGGEPFLWKDFPVILESLPQHFWILLTNLSLLPEWIFHPNIKLILPAYHEEYANENKFTLHLKKLNEQKKRRYDKRVTGDCSGFKLPDKV